MPALRNYHVFISHSWRYSEQYDTIKKWLDEAHYFSWSDYSIPISNPVDYQSKLELRLKISFKIASSSCVIILAGMYADYSDWIDYEIDTATKYGKPIIAIIPWGHERIPTKIQEKATELIGWNSSSVINAVRNLAIHCD